MCFAEVGMITEHQHDQNEKPVYSTHQVQVLTVVGRKEVAIVALDEK